MTTLFWVVMDKQENYQIFNSNKLVNICAPMVRYSKLPFRKLVRKYGCDLCFTPMIIADSFIKSDKARDNDFTYSKDDRPLIVQFAAKSPEVFAIAAQLVYPYCDGVDLNCGCPQQWATRESYGACLINNPQLVSEVVHRTRNAIPNHEFKISVKMRIHKDVRKTVSFAQQLESAGVSFLTVHGRTKDMSCEPVDVEAIALVKDCVGVPVVANGDVRTLQDAYRLCDATLADGVMSARGLLANPALFSGVEGTPLKCIRDWVGISLGTGTSFTLFHNHLIYMMEKSQSRAERRYFNALGSVAAVLDFLQEKYDLEV